MRQEIFLPESAFSADSFGVRTSPGAVACINNICAHFKDPLVHVRIRWIVEALKHPASTVGWVARLCRDWLSPGRATRIPLREIQLGQYSCLLLFKTISEQSYVLRTEMSVLLFS